MPIHTMNITSFTEMPPPSTDLSRHMKQMLTLRTDGDLKHIPSAADSSIAEL